MDVFDMEIPIIDFIKIYIKQNPNDVFIDVRTNSEFDFLHLPYFIHIPIANIQQNPEIIRDFEDKNIYFICKAGIRSYTACMLCQSIGINNVFNVLGGFDALKNSINDINFRKLLNGEFYDVQI